MGVVVRASNESLNVTPTESRPAYCRAVCLLTATIILNFLEKVEENGDIRISNLTFIITATLSHHIFILTNALYMCGNAGR